MSRIKNENLFASSDKEPSTAKLKSVRLYEDKPDPFCPFKYFIELIYEVENQYGVYEMIVPKMNPCIPLDCLPYITEEFSVDGRYRPGTIELDNLVTMPILGKNVSVKGLDGETVTANDATVVYRTVREKAVEMTIEELEKKLGHKIKLVSGKEKQK